MESNASAEILYYRCMLLSSLAAIATSWLIPAAQRNLLSENIDARNAIVAADATHYNGANKCEILKAFAKRGMGSNATISTRMIFSST
ncbi:hypothetical protein BASA60_003753 [Batrachochytrium salamandrivorans]|nr:hypothetical protein BASA60_003753 [Batrachochytrium salamandrivorans]